MPPFDLDCRDADYRRDPARPPPAKAQDEAEARAVHLVDAKRPETLMGLKYSDPLPTFKPEKESENHAKSSPGTKDCHGSR